MQIVCTIPKLDRLHPALPWIRPKHIAVRCFRWKLRVVIFFTHALPNRMQSQNENDLLALRREVRAGIPGHDGLPRQYAWHVAGSCTVLHEQCIRYNSVQCTACLMRIVWSEAGISRTVLLIGLVYLGKTEPSEGESKDNTSLSMAVLKLHLGETFNGNRSLISSSALFNATVAQVVIHHCE